MKNQLTTLIALGLFAVSFAASFAQPTFAQQVQFTLAQVKTGEKQTIVEPTTELVAQTYTVQVPYTENVTQSYEVQIPYTENVTQKYSVQVPYSETVTGDDGKTKQVQRVRTEERVRAVPIKRTRTETKTKVVPVQKMRKETRVRQVPVIRQRSAVKTVRFPPAAAKFAYVSGKEISSEKMKELAAETITILRIPAGDTLSDLQRQILKPDLIVMTMPRKEEAKAAVGETSEDDKSDKQK